MAKVLIANIGNRTLIAKNGNQLSPFEQREAGAIPKRNFKEDTLKMLEMLTAGDDSILEKLDINILPAVFQMEGIPEHIYLFTSDQQGENEARRRQDTLYAGEIIAQLLKKKYQSNVPKIEVIPLNGVSAVSLNDLTYGFRQEIRKIVKSHTNDRIIVCDSGGTPQQKNALKIVVEYLMTDQEPIFYQVREEYNEETGEIYLGKGTAVQVESQEIGLIVDEQNIGLLISTGEYSAAAQLRGRTKKDLAFTLLQIMHYRTLFLDETAQKVIGPGYFSTVFEQWQRANPALKRHFPSILDFISRKPTGDLTLWQEIFNFVEHKDQQEDLQKRFFRMCEVLQLGNFYWHLGDLTSAALTYFVFIERSLNAILAANNINVRNRVAFISILERSEKVKNYLFPYFGNRPPQVTIPSKIAYIRTELEVINNSKLRGLMDSIQNVISFGNNGDETGLDKLRNKIAHEGDGVTEQTLNQFVPRFEQTIKEWHQILGVPFEVEKNDYTLFNEGLNKYLRLS